VEKLGKNLVPAAWSADGKIIEALAHERFPNVLGVQFHPDYPVLWEKNSSVLLDPGKDPVCVRSYLEKRAPSLPFNRKIWIWFFSRARKFHDQKQAAR
jgi:putative glutamine amidotransferase